MNTKRALSCSQLRDKALILFVLFILFAKYYLDILNIAMLFDNVANCVHDYSPSKNH